MTISLCLIVANESALITRCLDSFAPIFDELCIVRACGNLKPDDTVERAASWCAAHGKSFRCDAYTNNALRADWPHVDDFAAARNLSFALASGDWITWADADDVISPEHASEIRALAEGGEWDCVVCGYDCRNGEIIERERLLRRSLNPRWVYPIHENLAFEKCRFTIRRDILWVHRPDLEHNDSLDRNLRIIDAHSQTNTRNLFFLHRDLYVGGEGDAAEKVGRAYLAMPDAQPNELYEVLMNLAQLAVTYPQKKELAARAYVLDPRRRESLCYLCSIATAEGNARDAVAFATAFDRLPVPEPRPWGVKQYLYNGRGEQIKARALRIAGNESEAVRIEQDVFASNGGMFSLIHATRGRPKQCLSTRAEWIRQAVHPENIEHVFGVDSDDGETLKAVRSYRHVIVPRNGCVAAFNAAAAASSGKVLVVMEDDLFPCPDWDVKLIAALNGRLDVPTVLRLGNKHRPGNPIGCGYVVTRARYEQNGWVFHPEFRGMYADNDFFLRAQLDGVIVDVEHIQFDHRHPFYTTGRLDADKTYAEENAPAEYKHGEEVFRRLNPGVVVNGK